MCHELVTSVRDDVLMFDLLLFTASDNDTIVMWLMDSCRLCVILLEQYSYEVAV